MDGGRPGWKPPARPRPDPWSRTSWRECPSRATQAEGGAPACRAHGARLAVERGRDTHPPAWRRCPLNSAPRRVQGLPRAPPAPPSQGPRARSLRGPHGRGRTRGGARPARPPALPFPAPGRGARAVRPLAAQAPRPAGAYGGRSRRPQAGRGRASGALGAVGRGPAGPGGRAAAVSNLGPSPRPTSGPGVSPSPSPQP